ncbi:MAG TPA: heme exporter protein CcmB [Telluria sp.]|jgi:heme exporter protein B
MLTLFAAVVTRDLQLAMRQRGEVLNTLVFFVIVASLFPFGVGPEPALLRAMAPGVLWVGALLASLLALERLFASDHADGALEQMVLAPGPLGVIVIGKVFAHWLLTGLPLLLVAPLIALQFGLHGAEIAVLLASLALGTPSLSLIGAVGAALTLGARGGGALLALLLLPLYVPVLIFGAGAAVEYTSGGGVQAHLLLLGGVFAFSAALAPWASAAALRIALE